MTNAFESPFRGVTLEAQVTNPKTSLSDGSATIPAIIMATASMTAPDTSCRTKALTAS